MTLAAPARVTVPVAASAALRPLLAAPAEGTVLGAGERSAADKARFYRFACRSATESAAILDVIRTLELTDSTRLQPGREYLLRIVQMLVRLGQSLE